MSPAWWGQVTLGPPAAFSRQQPLGMGLSSWNVRHEAPSLAPPLPCCPTLLPLGAAAPGLEERRETAGERVEGGRRWLGRGIGRRATVGPHVNS